MKKTRFEDIWHIQSNLACLKQSAVKVDPKIFFFLSDCVPKTVYPTLAATFTIFLIREKNYNKIDM